MALMQLLKELNQLNEDMSVITDKQEWIAAVKELGADDIVTELEQPQFEFPTNTTLIYALKDKKSYMVGSWNPNKKEGKIHKGKKNKGVPFDKRHRKFKEAK